MSETRSSRRPSWTPSSIFAVAVVMAVVIVVVVGLFVIWAPSQEPVVLENGRMDGAEKVEVSPTADDLLTISLDAGSNPWETVELILKDQRAAGYKVPSLKESTRKVCVDSGVAVPEWGLANGEDHTKLGVGFELKVNLTVLRAMASPSQTQTGVRG